MRQRGFTPIIILLVIAILGVAGYFVYTKGYITKLVSKNATLKTITPAPYPINTRSSSTPNPTAEPTPPDVVTGEVIILRMDGDTMPVQFISQSTKGNITQMMVWTDSNPSKKWQNYSSLLTLPVSDNVFAKYRDNLGNESQTYSDSIFPSNSPPNPI